MMKGLEWCGVAETPADLFFCRAMEAAGPGGVALRLHRAR